jgi:hypothetical protein
MNRAACDNDLLASCDELHGRLLKALCMVAAYGGAIGCVWFLCVSFRSGVL